MLQLKPVICTTYKFTLHISVQISPLLPKTYRGVQSFEISSEFFMVLTEHTISRYPSFIPTSQRDHQYGADKPLPPPNPRAQICSSHTYMQSEMSRGQILLLCSHTVIYTYSQVQLILNCIKCHPITGTITYYWAYMSNV